MAQRYNIGEACLQARMLLWEPERITGALTGKAGSEPWRGTLLGKRACCGLPFASGTFAWTKGAAAERVGGGNSAAACWERAPWEAMLFSAVAVVRQSAGKEERFHLAVRCERERLSNGKAWRRFQAAEEAGARFASRLQAGGGFRRILTARETDGRLAAYFLHTVCQKKARGMHCLRMKGRAFLFRQKLAKTNFKTEKLQ